jgi:hypothetical protein
MNEEPPRFAEPNASDDLPRLVFEAVGAASMCWEPRPDGVFNTTEATQVAEQLIADIRALCSQKVPHQVEADNAD